MPGGCSRLGVAAMALALAALAGCVHIDTSGFGGTGDSATFVVDGNTISIAQSGTITVSGTGTPLDYSGPLGCKGMYFSADYTDSTDLDFRYSADGADMLIGSDLYHFGPPTIGAKSLSWHQDFGDRDIAVTVACTLPASSSPPGATGSTTASSAT